MATQNTSTYHEEHVCAFQKTPRLRWLKQSEAPTMKQLQQIVQCVICGRIKWKTVPVVTINEEGEVIDGDTNESEE